MDDEKLRGQIEVLHTRYIQSIDEDKLEDCPGLITPHRNAAGDSALNLKYLSLAIIGLAAICAAVSVVRAQEPARSVWDGVYTEQQAKRGEPKYRENCADCHGDDLEGDAEAPALSGATFQTNWEGLPLGSLFQRIRRDMPLNKYVGTLSPSVNADILAYILKVNKFPQGGAELSHAAEILNQIRFESVKPVRKP